MRILILWLFITGLLIYPISWAKRYGERFCGEQGYSCIKVKSGQSWKSLFPNAQERDVVQRLNRLNIRLRPGMRLAVPNRLSALSLFDIAPFPAYITQPGEKVIYVSQKKLAWGAYDAGGTLQWWGPVSTGRNYCSDVKRGCRTPRGSYRMYHKRGRGCFSSKFPLGRGGAKMPYCMFFHRGFAMHGSYDVPGYRASHGCIRLFNQDAQWLNQQFIDLRGRGNAGTRVIIDPL